MRSRRAPRWAPAPGSLSRAPVQTDPLARGCPSGSTSPTARSPTPRLRHPPVRSRSSGSGTRGRAGRRARRLDDAVDDVVRVEVGMRRPHQRGDSRDDRRRAAGAVPQHEPAVGGDADEVLARCRHADRDALRRRLDARPALRVDAGDRQHAGDRRRRADSGRAAAAVARGDDDDDVVLERVEERVVPALVPVGRVGGQRQVDDVGAVVDRPADRLGDLVGERDLVAEEPKPTETDSSSASGATPIIPVLGAGAARRRRARRPSCRGSRRPRRRACARRTSRCPRRPCRRRRRPRTRPGRGRRRCR